MARKKQAALPVPSSRAEAVALATEYVSADRRMLELKVGYELRIDALKAERDRVLATIAAEQQGRFASLKAWWEAGGKALAGRGRSADVAGALMGIRKTPPAVKFARGINAKMIVDWLGKVVGGSAYLRTKVELDKPAVIKALQQGEAMAGPLAEQGITVAQADEFFIDTGLTEADARERLGASKPAGDEA